MTTRRMLHPAPARPSLQELLRKAVEAFNRMTPEQQKAHRREQAISFAYGQMMDCAPHITREEVARLYDELY